MADKDFDKLPELPVDISGVETQSFWDKPILCPVCENEYVHIYRPMRCSFVPGEDSGQAWEGRGDAMYVDMKCENDHEFELILGEHKGRVYQVVRNPYKI